MKCDMILKLAASTMVISASLTGCGPAGGDSVASASSTPASSKDGEKYASKAERALEKGNIEDAIAYAERSVAASGNDAATRALLGQAYLAAGRFYSAERSFLDAMDLGKSDARTILSLSLAQLAQGKANKARQLIENNRQFIPTADYGLALALAGDAKAAIDELEQAIRSANVTARTRQNLGLAYALDGRWKEAKLMAVQDISPTNVDARIMQWAQMARPGAYEMRVASVLDVKPAISDPGQPVRLALNIAPVVPAAPAVDYSREVASFDRDIPLPTNDVTETANSDFKADFLANDDNMLVTKVDVPASTAVSKTLFAKAPETPLIEAAAPKEVAVSAAKPEKKNISFTPLEQTQPDGQYLVQVGAFSSPENVQRAWVILSAKNRELSAYQHVSSTVKLNGKTLYRLSAVGFGNEQSAKALCGGIKAKGGGCIVRKVRSVGHTEMVGHVSAKSPQQLASR